MADVDLVERLIDVMSWKEQYLETQRSFLADTGNRTLDALSMEMFEDLCEEWDNVRARIAQVFIQQFTDEEISELITLHETPTARKMNSPAIRMALIQAMMPFSDYTDRPERMN